MYAYPQQSGEFMDSVVVSVKENPQILTYAISCNGVSPKLDLETKEFRFDKILLGRYVDKDRIRGSVCVGDH